MAEEESDDRLKSRQERMSGNNKQKSPVWMMFIFLVIIIIAAAFLVFPDETRRLLGLDTSSSKDIQTVSQIDNSGISTQIQPEATLEIDTPEPIVITPPTIVNNGLDEEAAKRIAELEKALADLANRPAADPGPTTEEIKKLLKQQAAVLKSEADAREQLLKAQMAALQAQLSVPTGLSSDQLAEQERLRLLAEEKARLRKELAERKSKREAELLERRVSDGNVYDESEEGQSASGSKDDETGVRELSGNEEFLKFASSQGHETVRASDIADISQTIVQGTLISAILETAIDTELPGNIRAQVMNPVYSFDGQTVLMPAGTRLIGEYNSDISIAQKRVLIAWKRAITPEGKSVKLAATGVDRLGRGGQRGNVDTRFFQKFGTAALITSISAIPSFLANDEATGNNSSTKAATGVAQDISDDLKDTTEDVLEEYLKLPPIIRIPQGTLMNVLVNQDLIFS